MHNIVGKTDEVISTMRRYGCDENGNNFGMKNVYYLRNSGVYVYDNIVFGVSSIIDKYMLSYEKLDELMILNNHIKTNYTKIIGLYHGRVRSQNTPTYAIKKAVENSTINLTNFDGYDIVMLGDIHQHYYLNDEKTIAYASSLISHNYGECDDNHGYILWNILDNTSEYVRIPNEYAYKIYDVEKFKTDGIIDVNKIDENIMNINRGHVRITAQNNSISATEKNIIESKIMELYPNVTIASTYQQKYVASNNMDIPDESNTYNMINTEDINIEKIIIDHVRNILIERNKKMKQDEIKLDDIDISEIIQILLEENRTNDTLKTSPVNDSWNIEMIMFDNLYTYGEGNVLDFLQYDLHTIVGMIGKNTYGKTSILDIISFAVYGETIRKMGTKKRAKFN